MSKRLPEKVLRRQVYLALAGVASFFLLILAYGKFIEEPSHPEITVEPENNTLCVFYRATAWDEKENTGCYHYIVSEPQIVDGEVFYVAAQMDIIAVLYFVVHGDEERGPYRNILGPHQYSGGTIAYLAQDLEGNWHSASVGKGGK